MNSSEDSNKERLETEITDKQNVNGYTINLMKTLDTNLFYLAKNEN